MSTCLVTGAGRGIGRAVAVALSAAGHRVALTARNAGELAETAALCSGETLVVPADITTAVDEVFGKVEAAFGPVEILVANAGGASSAPIARITDDEWQAMLDLNLTAPFRCVRRAVPGMVAAGHGRIVVIASVASKVGEPYIAAYTAAKHGVLGLVRSAAAELARTGVTVNAVCPGYVDTPMTEQSVAGIAEKTGRTAEEARQLLARKQPTGKLITVDEVAAAVLYCVGNGAVTGQGLNVDGGALQS
ncbi:SDR family NAD(P)-dependent oxidoreductase [Longispora albida]|uniref:SDR family NAD(P)-dependent oxidoreductase n=1 Tax=Longispora albida TaxID=203523 RepID=UPI000382C14B|nr:SDR family NAD(P)-dependent oxidoreductase [Longispora albida]